jgi:alcohol dehydrogenase class IV
MAPFVFDTVPTLRCGWGESRTLGATLAGRFAQRSALVVTFASFVRSGKLEPILANLRENGFAVTVFDRIVADPPEALVLEVADTARAAGVDIVLGIGGGSSLDTAKLIAVLLKSDQPISGMYGIGNIKGERAAPLVLVPTTAGTGSEVTPISVVTTGATTKMGVIAPQLMPDLAILDAELTVGLPPAHTAASGIDAMVHAIEAYTTRHKKNPLSDFLAARALSLLAANLVAACRDGTDRDAREAMLLGSTLAGQAFANAPCAAVHALAYPLGGHFHISHGLANALMLVPVLRFNARAVAPLYAELGDALGVAGEGTAEERAARFVTAIEALLEASGAPRRLRDAGVPEDAVPLLAAEAMKQTRLLGNNPAVITEADALRLYQEAY